MHWTPALMQQAEDRAHRIGQENSVLCHYIVGEQTLDDILYRKIEQKIAIVSNILDGQRKNLKIDLIRDAKGQETQENEDEEEDIEGGDEGKISQQESQQLSEQKQPKIQLENTAQKTKSEIISKSSANESISSDDSDSDDDEDLIEMMALKRIAEQELLRRKSQLQQASLRWGTLQTTEELEAADKISSNIKSTFPVDTRLDTSPNKVVMHHKENKDNHSSNHKTSKKKKKKSEEEIDFILPNSTQTAPISLKTPEKTALTSRISQSKPVHQESLAQQSSHASSTKISKQLLGPQITQNVKEIEKTSESCRKSKKLARGLDFIEKATNISSHINANKYVKGANKHAQQLEDEDGFEILIDYDAELDEDKENGKKLKQIASNLERKGLQFGDTMEKQPEEEKEHSAQSNLLDDFFEQQKFIPRFSSSSSSVTKRDSQGIQQASSGIRSRADFLEDTESPWEQEQAAKKLKKPSFFP